MRLPGWTAALVVVVSMIATMTAGATAGYAQTPGPPLTVPRADLDRSLTCFGNLATGGRAPVLLVPGTTLAPDVNFDWNYGPALAARRQAYCWVALPGNAMADIQNASEYVVNAVRTMSSRAGRPIQVVGFSQGGMVPRAALKYWPDTRRMVTDVVGIDPSNHGTLDAYPACVTPDPQVRLGCAPAIWQQQTASRFLTALNTGPETFAGIDYTVVYTVTDEVVFPNLPPAASSELRTGRGRISNVPVQRICPVHVAEHLSMGSTDPVGYAVVVDALDNPGPADQARVNRAVCLQDVMPGVNRAALPANVARYGGQVATTLATYPHVPAEPALRSPFSDG